ncbi:hypothetical protein RJ639_043113, partial [Escallonia herrerae]
MRVVAAVDVEVVVWDWQIMWMGGGDSQRGVVVVGGDEISSDEYSLRRAAELLMEVARRGEESGFGVPCLLIAAKGDLDSNPMAIKDSAMICEDMGIDAPVHMNNVFRRIINAAEKPHLGIPETEIGRNQKRFRQLVNRSFMLASVGAAAAVVGLAAYRAYAARKNTS